MPAVTLDAGGFIRNGKRFVPMGAHWVPAKAAMGWPLHFDARDIEADFAKMRDLGFSVARFDLLWAWFEPEPGKYNAKAFEQLDTLVALASKYDVYLHPSLFIGGEVGEAYWDVPWRNGRHPHKDPEMIRLETNLAAELGRRYADETAIIAWDVTDEPPFWIATDVTDAQAMTWTRAITDGIRRYDKKHPIVVGTAGQETSHGPFRADNLVKNDQIGFLSVHPFTIYDPKLFPDAMLSERSTYGAAFQIALSRGAGRPAMVHEMGASTAQYSPERVAQYERTSLYSALAAGSIGVDLWCFTDAAPEQWAQLPYLRTPQETEWGLVTWDRKDKPRGREFRRLAQTVARMTPSALAPADAAIVVPHEWAKPHGDFSRPPGAGPNGAGPIPYVSTEDSVGSAEKSASGNEWLMGSLLTSFILARRAGIKADFPREYGDWDKRPLVLLPSPLTATSTPFLTHVLTDFYARARRYVEGGGTLYASVAADAAIPNMPSLFGARLADTNTATQIEVRITKTFGALTAGETYAFNVPIASARYWGSLLEVEGGDVIAVDQDNHPAIVVNKLGRGTTILSAYPFESWLAVTPSAFDAKDFRVKPQLVDRLHRSIRGLAPKPRFEVETPEVEATALDAQHLVLVNHGPEPRHVEVRANVPVLSADRLTPTGKDPLPVAGGRFTVDLEPWNGAILEHR